MLEKHNTESFAIVLDGQGGIKTKTPLSKLEPSSAPLWLNIDYKDENNRKLLSEKLKLDTYIVDALLSPASHHKYFKNENPSGAFISLRSVDLREISKPSDMLTLKIWIDEKNIITSCHKLSSVVNDIVEKLNNGQGPKNIIEIFLAISQLSFHGISDITYKMIEKSDSFEEKIIKNKDKLKFNNKIADLRRKAITLHRYLMPQKEIFKNLPIDCPMFADPKYKNQFRDLLNDISKAIDNLDYSREHIIILKEEMENSINISINNNMYILSVVIAIFTPLTLLSGILGMNVKGIPFAESDYAFAAVCFIMILIAAMLFFIVKRKKIV